MTVANITNLNGLQIIFGHIDYILVQGPLSQKARDHAINVFSLLYEHVFLKSSLTQPGLPELKLKCVVFVLIISVLVYTDVYEWLLLCIVF